MATYLSEKISELTNSSTRDDYFTNKLNIISPWDYAEGATITDGVTDVTSILQLALNAAEDKELILPAGNLLISSGLQIRGNCNIKGAGIGLTTITCTRSSVTDSYNVFTNYNYTNTVVGNQTIKISDLTIDANCSTLTEIDGTTNSHIKGANGICLVKCEDSFVERVEVKNTGLNGILIADTAVSTVRDCVLENIGYIPFPNITDATWGTKASANGVTISNSGAVTGIKHLIENCVVKNVRDVGCNSWNMNNVTINNCKVIGQLGSVVTVNGHTGLTLEAGGGASSYGKINNCYVEDIDNGIQLDGEYCEAVGNTIKHSTAGTLGITIDNKYCKVLNNSILGTFNSGIYVRGSAAERADKAIIADNNILGCQFGINVNSCFEYLVDNNIIQGSSASGASIRISYVVGDAPFVAHGKITNNLILVSKSEGIYINYNHNVEISNNKILGATNAAIRNANANYCEIRDNIVDQYDGSTPCVYTILFEENPEYAIIKNNTFKNFSGNEATVPYGMSLAAPSTKEALVYHIETERVAPTLNAVLHARKGSVVQSYEATNGITFYTKNDNGTAGWINKNLA
jgi:hypothetical protein